MASITQEQVAAALAEIIQQELAHGEPVDLPGFGSFHIEHNPSQLEEKEDGDFVIKPPQDTVVFTPSH